MLKVAFSWADRDEAGSGRAETWFLGDEYAGDEYCDEEYVDGEYVDDGEYGDEGE